jgi:hypothetical protein
VASLEVSPCKTHNYLTASMELNPYSQLTAVQPVQKYPSLYVTSAEALLGIYIFKKKHRCENQRSKNRMV